MLRELIPEFRGLPIVRSRDPELWKESKILVDVGAVYDPATHRYDHHQRSFTETFGDGYDIKLSSAGLMWEKKKSLSSL